MGGYAVDPVELERAAGALGCAVVAARSALDPLRASATVLLTARWHGSAATAFRLGWEQWLEGVVAMLRALDELTVALRGSGAGYAATEESVRTTVGAGPM
ncbi:MAG: WXG100 family type VII secretion target [Jatrophihabitans sp.]|uniref:WXG100 family type VII secretion target n=1 Tax=Jatrophihabitans sp. TaxID=1932789 RepID=UPI003914A687